MGIETLSKPGVANSYGPRGTGEQYGGQGASDDSIIKEAIWQFEYNNLPNHTGAAVNIVAPNMQQQIPAGATIVSARLIVDTAFASTSTTTDLDVGLYYGTGTGTAIDADGLITVAQATQTAIGTAGNVVTGAGALVGAAIGANAGVLVVTPNVNDLTAGAGRVLVSYIYDR